MTERYTNSYIFTFENDEVESACRVGFKTDMSMDEARGHLLQCMKEFGGGIPKGCELVHVPGTKSFTVIDKGSKVDVKRATVTYRKQVKIAAIELRDATEH